MLCKRSQKAAGLLYGHNVTVKSNGALSISPGTTSIVVQDPDPGFRGSLEDLKVMETTNPENFAQVVGARLGQLVWQANSRSKFFTMVLAWDVQTDIEQEEVMRRRVLLQQV